MKAKELIKILQQYPEHDVRLMYADCSDVSFDQPYPKYIELQICGIDGNITTETLKTAHLAYEEI